MSAANNTPMTIDELRCDYDDCVILKRDEYEKLMLHVKIE